MKIMNLEGRITILGCPNFRHLSVFLILVLISGHAFSLEYKIATNRAPASAFEEEVLTVPLEKKVMFQSLFAEDDAGVMKGMRDSLNSWQETQDYAQRWDLESTRLYKTPTTNEKTRFITGNLLRYVDKRFAGEVKNAEEGSTFQTVGKLEKSLRPSASVPVSKYLSLKFKVRVLEGKAVMEVRNPWVECNAILTSNGKAKVLTKKEFSQLGTTTGFEYNIREAQWVAYMDQVVTENIKARMSSTTLPHGVDADKRIEMMANFPFNL